MKKNFKIANCLIKIQVNGAAVFISTKSFKPSDRAMFGLFENNYKSARFVDVMNIEHF
jgi:hypothetical protein